jgi:hypothetical protein
MSALILTIGAFAFINTILCIAGTAAPTKIYYENYNDQNGEFMGLTFYTTMWKICTANATSYTKSVEYNCESIDFSGVCTALHSRYNAARAFAIMSIFLSIAISVVAVGRIWIYRFRTNDYDTLVFFLNLISFVFLLITYPIIISLKTVPGCGTVNPPNVFIGGSGILFLVAWILTIINFCLEIFRSNPNQEHQYVVAHSS